MESLLTVGPDTLLGMVSPPIRSSQFIKMLLAQHRKLVLLLDMVDNSFGLCKSFLGGFFVRWQSGQVP